MVYAHLTAEDKARFWDDGFFIKRRFFDDEEVGFVRRALVEDATQKLQRWREDVAAYSLSRR